MAREPIDALLVVVVRDDRGEPVALRVEAYRASSSDLPITDIVWAEEESWMTAWLIAGRLLWSRFGRRLR